MVRMNVSTILSSFLTVLLFFHKIELVPLELVSLSSDIFLPYLNYHLPPPFEMLINEH